MDAFGNQIAREGYDRCWCGCKYWENDRCVDCHTYAADALPEVEHTCAYIGEGLDGAHYECMHNEEIPDCT